MWLLVLFFCIAIEQLVQYSILFILDSLHTVDKQLSMDYYSDVSVALLDNCSFLTACLYVPFAFVAYISLHAVQHCCQNVVSFPG